VRRAVFRRTFNSLSRDHQLFCFGSVSSLSVIPRTFNSLSRDHSSPITRDREDEAVARGTFNSLSRDHPTSCWWSQSNALPFNSLSRDHEEEALAQRRAAESSTFNSLSRDHSCTRSAVMVIPSAFNSLSRDHKFGFTLLGLVEVRLRFQLPLAGSPSPIPGFFGSPRLSAAAPLRTNDS
jgi:hypothetical protein